MSSVSALARAAISDADNSAVRSAGAAASNSDSPCGELTCANSEASRVTDEARTAPTTSGSSSRVASPSYGRSTRIWSTPARPTSLHVWMPSPSATTLPVARSMTEMSPRIKERMPSSVQKKAARLGRSSILKSASRPARSVIELDATISSHRVLIKEAHSWVGGSSTTNEVGPDSTTQSPGVYVARQCPSAAVIGPPQASQLRLPPHSLLARHSRESQGLNCTMMGYPASPTAGARGAVRKHRRLVASDERGGLGGLSVSV